MSEEHCAICYHNFDIDTNTIQVKVCEICQHKQIVKAKLDLLDYLRIQGYIRSREYEDLKEKELKGE